MVVRSAGSRRTVLVRGSGSIGVRHARAVDAAGHRAIIVPVRSERMHALDAAGHETAATICEAVARGADAAIIATDTARHVADVEEAMRSGCITLCEKPLAPSILALDRAVEDSWTGRVFVAYCLRFHEGIAEFKRRLHEIGDVHSVRIECQSYLPDWRPKRDYRESYSARLDEGGVLRDLSHEIDYAVWLFGAPREITARLEPGTRLGIPVDAAAEILWRSDAGTSVSLRLDYLTRRARRGMIARGSRGEVEWDAIAGMVRVAVDGAESLAAAPHDRDGMMRRQVEALLGEARTDLCRLDEGLAVLAICDAARQSSIDGHTISVPETRR